MTKDQLIMIRKTDNISINSLAIIKQSIIILSPVYPSGNITRHVTPCKPWEQQIKNYYLETIQIFLSSTSCCCDIASYYLYRLCLGLWRGGVLINETRSWAFQVNYHCREAVFIFYMRDISLIIIIISHKAFFYVSFKTCVDPE